MALNIVRQTIKQPQNHRRAQPHCPTAQNASPLPAQAALGPLEGGEICEPQKGPCPASLSAPFGALPHPHLLPRRPRALAAEAKRAALSTSSASPRIPAALASVTAAGRPSPRAPHRRDLGSTAAAPTHRPRGCHGSLSTAAAIPGAGAAATSRGDP